MVELLEKMNIASERMAETREKLESPVEKDDSESRIRSVYASLAIEDPSVTIEEVRRVLADKSTA